jgi:hypothetical protein
METQKHAQIHVLLCWIALKIDGQFSIFNFLQFSICFSCFDISCCLPQNLLRWLAEEEKRLCGHGRLGIVVVAVDLPVPPVCFRTVLRRLRWHDLCISMRCISCHRMHRIPRKITYKNVPREHEKTCSSRKEELAVCKQFIARQTTGS